MAFRNLLVAYDSSDLSKKALLQALNLVRDNPDAHIHVAHVYQFPTLVVGEAIIPAPASLDKDYYDQMENKLNEAKELLSSYPNTTFVLKQGEPAAGLLQYADEHNCDLVVMGSRGLGGLKEFVLGSVSHHLLQHSKIPVLVIK